MRKLKKTKSKGRKIEDVVASVVKKEVELLAKDLKQQLGSDFSSLAANLTESIITGKFNARSTANAVARAFQPEIKDFFNRSISQNGSNLFAIFTKAQRNL